MRPDDVELLESAVRAANPVRVASDLVESAAADGLRVSVKQRTRLVPGGTSDQPGAALELRAPDGSRRRRRPVGWPVAAVAFVLVLVVGGAAVVLLTSDDSQVPVGSSTDTTGAEAIQVVFDGEECTVEGPMSVPANTVVPVVLTNESNLPVQINVARLSPHQATGEVRAFDDLVEMQRAGGGVLWEDPMNWLWPSERYFGDHDY